MIKSLCGQYYVRVHEDHTKITRNIYKKWTSGAGRKPTSWETLLEVFKEIKLVSLAEEINDSLNGH